MGKQKIDDVLNNQIKANVLFSKKYMFVIKQDKINQCYKFIIR